MLLPLYLLFSCLLHAGLAEGETSLCRAFLEKLPGIALQEGHWVALSFLSALGMSISWLLAARRASGLRLVAMIIVHLGLSALYTMTLVLPGRLGLIGPLMRGDYVTAGIVATLLFVILILMLPFAFFDRLIRE